MLTDFTFYGIDKTGYLKYFKKYRYFNLKYKSIIIKRIVNMSNNLNLSSQKHNNLNVTECSNEVNHTLSDSYSYEIGQGYIKCLHTNRIIKREPEKDSLPYFIVHNNLEKLTEMLEKGIDPNERDLAGVTCSWTPLYWSSKLRNIEAIKILLEYGADINLVVHDDDEICGTVLDLASLRLDNELEELLREYARETGTSLSNSFKAIRFKCRGKAPSFDFRK